MPATRCAPSSPGPRAVHRPARGEGGGDSDGGTAAVEFAIVLPVLLLVLFGIFDFGRMMQQQIQITEAAREGARIAAVGGTDPQVRTQLTNTLGAAFQAGDAPAAVTLCPAASAVLGNSTVVVTHKFVPVTPIFPVMKIFNSSTTTPASITLTATGVMSCVG